MFPVGMFSDPRLPNPILQSTQDVFIKKLLLRGTIEESIDALNSQRVSMAPTSSSSAAASRETLRNHELRTLFQRRL
jgi:hypothetical protein